MVAALFRSLKDMMSFLKKTDKRTYLLRPDWLPQLPWQLRLGLNGALLERTALRSAPHLPPAPVQAGGVEMVEATPAPLRPVAAAVPPSPLPPASAATSPISEQSSPGSITIVATAPREPSSAAAPPPPTTRRRWLPRWLYVAWCPFLLTVYSYTIFNNGYLSFDPAGNPAWLSPLLLAASFIFPTLWLTITSSERWRALPRFRFVGWMAAFYWYCTRFAYWPALLLQIDGFTGVEEGKLADCRGTTPGGVVRYVPSAEATLSILRRWAASCSDWNPMIVRALTGDYLPELARLYQVEGALAVQGAIIRTTPLPYWTFLQPLTTYWAVALDWPYAATVGLLIPGAFLVSCEWYAILKIWFINCFGPTGRLPPADLSSIGQGEFCKQLVSQISLYIVPILALLLDPYQYGLPVDLLLERALHYLEALLVEDNLFSPDTWVEPPAYPELPPLQSKAPWYYPSRWWELAQSWWKK